MVLSLNANGTQADPRYQLRADAGPRLREHLHETWFGRFLPFPACFVAQQVGAERSGLVGFVSAEVVPDLGILAFPPTARFDNLWVEPAWRRQGLARMLVEQLQTRARAAGYTRFSVSTLVQDARAVAFWRDVGFVDLFVVLAREP
jgi:ribosomal protein S18 acetylase RimI-like enzyme